MKNRVAILMSAALLSAGGLGAMIAHSEMSKAVPTHTISVKRRKSSAEDLVNRYVLSYQIRKTGWSVAQGKRMATKVRNRRRNKRAHGGC
ncbi:hypothetical protein OR16_31644 [Cupriavidus basilensis OR16]|uniref:Uncharacterized protein n=1 Tax=Cupriavidus basilensis OR16 TaxID=1127483 RepID=H1SDM3_9BURK|nr:hypothetical protein [Cupriavidus basilensis]EHP39408.1 hypothetical protein OR16_31644 [Cupriavidus basilensis OR16]